MYSDADSHKRSHAPTIFGSASIFLTFVPYCLATAIQFTSIQTALIVGTAAAAAVLLFGLAFYWMAVRHVRELQHHRSTAGHLKPPVQVPVHILDVGLLVIFAVQLGLCFPFETVIANNFNFFTNGALALLTLVRLSVTQL